MEDRVLGVVSTTVTEQVPDLVLSTVDVAVMIVEPTPTAVTVPFSTVATELFPVDQLTLWDGLFVPLTVTLKTPVNDPFKSRFKASGETATELTVGTGSPLDAAL